MTVTGPTEFMVPVTVDGFSVIEATSSGGMVAGWLICVLPIIAEVMAMVRAVTDAVGILRLSWLIAPPISGRCL